MARNLAYYIDPEEERRKEALIAETFGGGAPAYGPPPPPPPPNLGRAPAPAIPIDMTTPRRTDGNYAGFRDPYQDQDPSPEEVAADEAAEEEEDEALEREPPPQVAANRFGDDRKLDILLDDPYGPGLGDWASRFRLDPALNMDPRAYADLKRAPGSVDKTAASVSAEQKGVPATPTPAQARAMAIADNPPTPARDATNLAADVARTPQQGERSDFFGFDDEEGWAKERERRVQAVREAYGQEDAPSHHWEEELLRERGDDRLTDAQIRRRGAAIGFFGALADDPQAGARWAQQQHANNRDFEVSRDRARERDVAGARIPLSLAEAITASVPAITPEAAAQLRNNSPLVKAFQNGMYSQGGRREGQEMGLSKEKLRILNGMKNARTKEEFDAWRAQLGSATQLGVAETYANKGQPTTPEALAASANAASSVMAQALGPNVTLAQGEAALKGDYRGLTPEQARKASIVGPQILAKASRPEGLGRVLDDSIKTHANQPVRDELAIQKSVELIKRNPERARKWQEAWTSAQLPLKNALSGWRSMSPAAKTALAQWTQTNKDGSTLDIAHLGDQWQKYNDLTPEDQIHVSRVLGAINEYVKANAGSAVTGSEWDRIAHRVGMATGTWAPFNNPEVIGQFLIDAANAMNQNRADYERIMGGWK